jgi:hypothetical protein
MARPKLMGDNIGSFFGCKLVESVMCHNAFAVGVFFA